MALRAGAILAVTDVDRSVAFYRDRIGFEVEALYDDPPYATLTLAGTRLSLAEQGIRGAVRATNVRLSTHVWNTEEDITRAAEAARSGNDDLLDRRANVVLVVETDDARAEHRRLADEGVRFLAEPYEPPWGGCRFFCVDPDGYLVEIEQPA